MYRWGIIPFICNSIPEEFLLILMSSFLIGRKNILHNNKKMVYITTIITALITVLSRHVFSNIFYITVIQILLFIILYRFLLKFTWGEALLGFLTSLIIYSLTETISLIIVSLCFKNINIYSNDFILVLVAIPQRLLQIAITYIIWRAKIIIIDTNKLLYNFKRISLISVYLLLTFAFIVINGKNYLFGFELNICNIIELCFNIFFVIGLSILGIYFQRQLVKNSKNSEKNRMLFLYWLKDIIDKNNDIDSIKSTINSAIEYNKLSLDKEERK